jgi:hypothetical protein
MKSPGENILSVFIENLIARRESELTAMVRRQTVFNTMLEILDNYHYGNDEWRLMIEAAA